MSALTEKEISIARYMVLGNGTAEYSKAVAEDDDFARAEIAKYKQSRSINLGNLIENQKLHIANLQKVLGQYQAEMELLGS